MITSIRGEETWLSIPPDGEPGGSFIYEIHAETEKVFASTLHMIPGMDILFSKPVIWATVSHAFDASQCNQQEYESWVAKGTGSLLEAAQEALSEKAIDAGCNAVLGMTINIATTNGAQAENGILVATVCGTPCSLVSNDPAPANVLPLPLAKEARRSTRLFRRRSKVSEEVKQPSSS